MSKKVENEVLKNHLLSDLKLVGVPTDFELVFKDYSSTCYGKYLKSKKLIIIYIYMDKECTTLFPYNKLLETLVHEAIHHYQHHYEEDFVRYKGIMHNPNFYKYFNECVEKLRYYGIEVCEDEEAV